MIKSILSRWRIIPKVSFINYGKKSCFNRLFYCSRMWSGKLIYFGIKHYAIEFDFRKDWLADMVNPNR